MVLAAGFLYMSFDEAAQLHEGVVARVGALLRHDSGVLHYVWYILFVPVIAIALMVYVQFLRDLPRPFTFFIASGALFIGGALGVELIEAWAGVSGTRGGDRAVAAA